MAASLLRQETPESLAEKAQQHRTREALVCGTGSSNYLVAELIEHLATHAASLSREVESIKRQLAEMNR